MGSDIGLIGLGVMGSNIALNLADRGHKVAVFNQHADRIQAFLQEATEDQQFVGCQDYATLVSELSSPRVLMLMVTAGDPVDQIIDQLLPHLQPGDIIVDGGNSFYQDTERRYQSLKPQGIRFLGMGVSGGEEGARQGPSLMPGGDPEAWPVVEAMFQSIAAIADDGEPCCRWVGEGGAGHYVKMIHNGIEYGDMQLIAEAWHLMDEGLQLDALTCADRFAEWNQGRLSSYLIEITADILRVSDPDGRPRVENILDSAGQKGTGRWTAIDALQLGVPLTLIGEAVYARMLSARKAERTAASAKLAQEQLQFLGDVDEALQAIEQGLYAAKIVSYAQGFMQMREAASTYGWNLAFGDIALLWRAGCIIRSRFLDDIKKAFDSDSDLVNLLFDDYFSAAVSGASDGWRKTVVLGVQLGIPLPAMGAALSFYDGYRSEVLPANLLQAQRDYFGAHTYQRVDQPDGVFHTHWTAQDHQEQQLDD